MVVDDNKQSVFAYERRSKDGKHLLIVLNFTNNYHESYTIPVTQAGVYKEIINSDKNIYSGNNLVNSRQIKSKKIPALNKPYSIQVKIAPFTGMIFELKNKSK